MYTEEPIGSSIIINLKEIICDIGMVFVEKLVILNFTLYQLKYTTICYVPFRNALDWLLPFLIRNMEK